MTTTLDEEPRPLGELTLAQQALPKDSNGNNKVYAGWVVSQMDLAAAMAAQRITRSHIATVTIDGMIFVAPIKLGSTVSFYTRIGKIGRSSITIFVEVWAQSITASAQHKVTEAQFVLVAMSEKGRSQLIDQP